MNSTMIRLIRIVSTALFCIPLIADLRAEKYPNILIILVDDMGYGDPRCYNPASGIPTPNIDRLAQDGMRFTDAHAAGALCHPSRYGLMTGQYPFRANPGAWRTKATIDADRMTIASLLKSRGYRTAMVGKWHLGFDENGYNNPLPGGPVDRGFESYFGIRASTDIPPYFYIRDQRAVAPPSNRIEAMDSPGWSPIQGAFWRAGGIAPNLELENVLPRFTDEAIEVIRNHSQSESESKEPLMLYLAYPAPHTPWLPSETYLGSSRAGMYGDFMVMVDAMIGRVLKAINRAGMQEDTMVIFSSDNGPVWYDKDVYRFKHDSSGGLRGMKGDAWENGHRMPFIVKWPGNVKPGSVSKQTICFTDMLATFADITDTELPDAAGPDSFSILPILKGSQEDSIPVRENLIIPSANGTLSMRKGPWKLITTLGSGGFSKPRQVRPTPNGPKGQLYHLGKDLSESQNLYLQEPEIVEQMLAEMQQVVSSGRSRR